MRAKLYKLLILVLICLISNKLVISCKEKNNQLDFIRGKQIEMKPEIEQDEQILQSIEPYKTELKEEVEKELCYNVRLLTKREAALETSLGNLLADICLAAGDSIYRAETGRGIDFALFNYGGLRASLNEGTIRVKDVFQLMPFENRLVVVELNGKQVGDLIDFLVRQKKAHPFAGLRLELTGNSFSKAEIRGERFDPKKNYYVLTHDYLQHGGNNMIFFTKPLQLYVSDLKVRDALLESFAKTDTLKAKLDGRFTNSIDI